MDSERIIKFVLAIYKITEKFPKDEPLKLILKKNSCNLLEDYFLYFFQKNDNNLNNLIKGKILAFYNLFLIAEKQNWVDKRNFEILKKELLKIKDSLNIVSPYKNPVNKKNLKEPLLKKDDSTQREERCQKILQILEEKESIKPADLQIIFPNITKRTIRRDLRYLYETKKIIRVGEKNNIVYKLNRTIMVGQNNNLMGTNMS